MSALSSPSAPYGIRAVRQIKATNTSSAGPKISSRLQKRKERTFLFFLEKVDPILGDCITRMLIEQPADVPRAMIHYLKHCAGKASQSEKVLLPEHWPAIKPKKEMKLFLATNIGPVVAKLVNRIAVVLPDDVIAFMIEQLQSMLQEDALIPDRADLFPSSMPTPSLPAASSLAKKSVPSPSVLPATAPPSSAAVAEAAVSSTAALATSSAKSSQVEVTLPASSEPKEIRVAIFGLGGVGKTSLVNILQGKYDPSTKPTVGFRPVTMALDADTQVKLFDLGGGPRIRDIWKNYYHDIHGVIYVLNAAVEESNLEETLRIAEQTLSSPFLNGKPLLIFANQQDKHGARPASFWQDVLPIPQEYDDNLYIAECSSFVPADVDSETYQPDPNIESALELLLKSILEKYNPLQERVAKDCKVKVAEEAQARLQKEKKVLRNKIASAFFDQLDPEIIQQLEIEADPKNVFTVEEGEAFLAAEIGEEALNPIALDIAAMTGYQRLALQIVGALKVPISKKKVPMTWDEIHALIKELREELRLP
eukprot:gene9545-10550_t